MFFFFFLTEDTEISSGSDPSNGSLGHEEQARGFEEEGSLTNSSYTYDSRCPPTATAQCATANTPPSRSTDSRHANHTSSPPFSSPPQSTESVSRPAVITNSQPISSSTPLSPAAKSFPSAYERSGSYIPPFHFNTAYPGYVNHSYSSNSLSQPPYSAVDHAPQQPYSFHHPMNYNVAAAVNSSHPAPHPYLTNSNHATSVNGDLTYHHLSYAHRSFSPPYDIYKREGLQQSYSDSGLDNRSFIARPTPSYDPGGRQPTMYYHTTQHDSFHCKFISHSSTIINRTLCHCWDIAASQCFTSFLSFQTEI